MRRTAVLVLTGLLALGSPTTLPVAAQGQNSPAPGLTIPIVGLVTGTIAGVFNGAATITGFAVQNLPNGQQQLVAVGTLVGTVTNAAGVVVQSIAATFTAPVSQQQAACSILNLVLGPIHLDLLGLVVDTNEIMLNITAVPGAGNLLGNLLCSVAGLLDAGGSLARIVRLLTAILGVI
jgi:hypothetical protein